MKKTLLATVLSMTSLLPIAPLASAHADNVTDHFQNLSCITYRALPVHKQEEAVHFLAGLIHKEHQGDRIALLMSIVNLACLQKGNKFNNIANIVRSSSADPMFPHPNGENTIPGH